MRATPGEIPLGDDWCHELKWDGMRLQIEHRGNGAPIRIWSGSGRDLSEAFPELHPLASALPLPATIDGEAVVFRGQTPDFSRLQHRIHQRAPSTKEVTDYPVVFVAFDLLRLDNRSLRNVSYLDRRRLLHQVFPHGHRWICPPNSEGRAAGQDLLSLARSRSLEGVVSKRGASSYQSGVRSKDWVKTKLTLRQEFVIGGWLEATRSSALGSLVIGTWDASGHLRFAATVASGLTEHDRQYAQAAMLPSPQCPFTPPPTFDRPVHWGEPTMVAEVRCNQWPADGALRHPVFLGFRTDADPGTVVREIPIP